MMATDLDQRVLPNELTLPLIPIGLAVLVWGGDSLVNRQPAWLAIAGRDRPAGSSRTVCRGCSSARAPSARATSSSWWARDCLLGAIRLVLAVFVGAMLGGVVIVALLVTRRITLKTYVPYGPFLIVGVVWAALLPATT